MRCLAITLNAAIDTTYVLDTFTPGAVNRVSRSLAVPGGKGNNVARVLALLGHSVVASGFVGGRAGRFIEHGLRAMGIETAFIDLPGESRTCLTVIERASGTVSELLEPGIEVSARDGQGFLTTAAGLASDVDVIAVCGSLPAGLPSDYYARLLGVLGATGKPLAFDASGEALRLGLAAKPDLIKPNAVEMAALAQSDGDPDGLVAFARDRLIGRVLAPDATVLLSLGAQGAALITRCQALRASPPQVPVVNPVGSGDALLAGFLAARETAGDDAAALIEAVAVGTAAALQETAGVIDQADVERLRAGVALRALCTPAPAL